MKKITTIATALCLATAFCGMCTGCAKNIEEGSKKDAAPTVAVAADTDYKVILNPGWYYSGSTKKLNKVETTGAKALSETEKDTYFAENGYIATVAANAELPKATTDRSGMTFTGWAYAKDGEVVPVKTMPSKLTDNLYLFAQWYVKGSGGEIPIDPPEEPDDPVTGTSYITVGGTKYDLSKNEGTPTSDGRSMEYWLGKDKTIKLTANTTATLTIEGKEVKAFIDGSSLGIDKSDTSSEQSSFKITKTGDFKIFLRYYPSGNNGNGSWTVEFAGPASIGDTSDIPDGKPCTITFSGGDKITLYFKYNNQDVKSFSNYKIWMWNDGDDFFEKWPGEALTETINVSTKTLSAETCVIINWNNGGEQTQTLKGFEAGCSYVVTLANKGGSISKITK